MCAGVLIFCLIGAYGLKQSLFDVWVMLGFGLVGYVLRKLQYEFSPFLIAFVLAQMLEQSLRQSLVMSPHGMLIFAERPIAACLIGISLILVVLVFRQRKLNQPGGDI
jgi:putative tricarboxylic transport membrane protein